MTKLFLIVFLLAALGGALGNTASASNGKRFSQHNRNSHMIYTHDFLTATVIVGRYYGSNVRWWLVNCSNGEGGHGGFVWRDHIAPRQGEDKPGGWLQFFRSTFDSNVGWAWHDARSRGMHIDPRAKNYYEPLGQAVVAAAMYSAHGNPGTWTGYGC